jgi:hypothetical protein
MISAQQQAAEKALRDRERLYRNYRASKKRQYEELFAIPVHGKLLWQFNARLRAFGIKDPEQMVKYVQRESLAWLKWAPEDIRAAALEMVGYRIVRIRARAGLVPFDDPLPDEEPDVFQLCKRELGL